MNKLKSKETVRKTRNARLTNLSSSLLPYAMIFPPFTLAFSICGQKSEIFLLFLCDFVCGRFYSQSSCGFSKSKTPFPK